MKIKPSHSWKNPKPLQPKPTQSPHKTSKHSKTQNHPPVIILRAGGRSYFFGGWGE